MKIKFILDANDLEGNPIVCTEVVENGLGIVPRADEFITLNRDICLRVDSVFYEVVRGGIFDVTIRLENFTTDSSEKLKHFLNVIEAKRWSIVRLN